MLHRLFRVCSLLCGSLFLRHRGDRFSGLAVFMPYQPVRSIPLKRGVNPHAGSFAFLLLSAAGRTKRADQNGQDISAMSVRNVVLLGA